MAGFLNLWSKTAASNSNSDSTINWAEGQLPSTVNGSARAEMAAIASWRDDINGSLTTAGSANAYTVTTNIAFTALATGLMIAFKANHTNTGAATLNANSLGAKALRTPADAALVAGQIASGGKYYALYDSTFNSSNGAWVVLNLREIATNAEARTATDTSKAITPANHIASHGPRFHARRASSQTPTADTWTKIQIDTEDYDSDGCYDNATNYRFTPTVSGYYFIFATLSSVQDADGGVVVRQNGTDSPIFQYNSTSALFTQRVTASGVLFFNGSTDYAEAFGYSSYNAAPAFNSASFGAFRIGP